MKLSTKILSLALAAGSLPTAYAEWEWAGTFELNDSSHTWIAQKTGGSYVDPSMKIVFYAVDDPSDIDATIHKYEDEAAALIDEGDACKDINSGDTINPTGQACYTLVFDQASDDSKFPINTDGLKGMVVFGQHIPIEFERDMHYIKDSKGFDIEPVIEEGAEGHDHSHADHAATSSGESCACAAKGKFNIDCSAKQAMLDALSFLKSAGCATDCSSEACEKSYLIVQAHHDYCPIDKVPQEVEDGFHDYDSTCVACEIKRGFIDGAPNCPAAKCDATTGNSAYTALVEAGCLSDCSSDTCRDNFFVLVVEHDLCPHDTLSRASEEGLHDLEEPCAKQLCNVEGAEMTAPVCDDHDDHGHTDGHSSDDQGPDDNSSGAVISAAFTGAAALLAAAFMMA